ncbi:MAG: hypothetical protein RI958_2906 [Actinomycetota bacterium]
MTSGDVCSTEFPTLGHPEVHVRWSTRDDGDFHLDQERSRLERTRRSFVDLPWSQPDEVHGDVVGVVEHPGHLDGAVADALVTDRDGAVLGIWVGDCAPVALVSESGAIGAVHAGWRGIEAGVLQRAVEALRGRSGDLVEAVLGPCIRPCCYDFGDDDLARLARRYGASVCSVTRRGRRSLDVPAAVRAALREVSVPMADRGGCTSCEPERYWSHRARGERGRQVLAIWRQRPGVDR